MPAVLLPWRPLICPTVPKMGVDPVGETTWDIYRKAPEQLLCAAGAPAVHSGQMGVQAGWWQDIRAAASAVKHL